MVGATVPDLRGEFIRGLDLGRGIDSGRILRSIKDSYGGNITFQVRGAAKTSGGGNSALGNVRLQGMELGYGEGSYSNEVNISPTGDIYPRNIALLPCIKY